MKAVVEIKGHQYTIQAGDLIDVELFHDELQKKITINTVQFVYEGNAIFMGKPYVESASVEVLVVYHGKADKQIILRRKAGKYMKKNGHRQNYTSLLVTKIQANNSVSQIDESSGRYKKYMGIKG